MVLLHKLVLVERRLLQVARQMVLLCVNLSFALEPSQLAIMRFVLKLLDVDIRREINFLAVGRVVL